jgi:RNA polymerase sigma-70 factor, ECF subfamily
VSTPAQFAEALGYRRQLHAKAALMTRNHTRLTGALQRLPAEFRMAVYLADVEGFGYREIAEITHCPIGTVMSRLHRGRSRLRELLKCV